MAATSDITLFQNLVWEYFQTTGRHDLPWRLPDANGQFDPYVVLVSEFMLQQTQVSRVIPKFHAFLQLFPSIKSLAEADLGAVLTAWSGLGYNRRAKFLWQAAGVILRDYDGRIPDRLESLVSLPGIGKNTAGAILAYAFNLPVVFIETNIRSVYIHHFFADKTQVSDGQVAELVEQTLDTVNPREWYWALMDYGSYLKKTTGNASRQSKTYTKQSTFHGSRRQIRGQVLKHLMSGPMTLEQLQFLINDERLQSVLTEQASEGLIRQSATGYHL